MGGKSPCPVRQAEAGACAGCLVPLRLIPAAGAAVAAARCGRERRSKCILHPCPPGQVPLGQGWGQYLARVVPRAGTRVLEATVAHPLCWWRLPQCSLQHCTTSHQPVAVAAAGNSTGTSTGGSGWGAHCTVGRREWRGGERSSMVSLLAALSGPGPCWPHGRLMVPGTTWGLQQGLEGGGTSGRSGLQSRA